VRPHPETSYCRSPGQRQTDYRFDGGYSEYLLHLFPPRVLSRISFTDDGVHHVGAEGRERLSNQGPQAGAAIYIFDF